MRLVQLLQFRVRLVVQISRILQIAENFRSFGIDRLQVALLVRMLDNNDVIDRGGDARYSDAEHPYLRVRFGQVRLELVQLFF